MAELTVLNFKYYIEKLNFQESSSSHISIIQNHLKVPAKAAETYRPAAPGVFLKILTVR